MNAFMNFFPHLNRHAFKGNNSYWTRFGERARNRINNNFHFLKRARIHQARTENGFLGNATIVFFSKLRLIFYTIFSFAPLFLFRAPILRPYRKTSLNGGQIFPFYEDAWGGEWTVSTSKEILYGGCEKNEKNIAKKNIYTAEKKRKYVRCTRNKRAIVRPNAKKYVYKIYA